MELTKPILYFNGKDGSGFIQYSNKTKILRQSGYVKYGLKQNSSKIKAIYFRKSGTLFFNRLQPLISARFLSVSFITR